MISGECAAALVLAARKGEHRGHLRWWRESGGHKAVLNSTGSHVDRSEPYRNCNPHPLGHCRKRFRYLSGVTPSIDGMRIRRGVGGSPLFAAAAHLHISEQQGDQAHERVPPPMGKGARNRKRHEQKRERQAARAMSGGGLFGPRSQGAVRCGAAVEAAEHTR